MRHISNFLVLQWLFIRVHRQAFIKPIKYTNEELGTSYPFLFSPQQFEVELRYTYTLQYWVVPCTGWITQVRYIGKSRSVNLSQTAPKAL